MKENKGTKIDKKIPKKGNNQKKVKNMKATHKCTEGKTNRQLANMALKAMSAICDEDNGTIRNPYELASSVLADGRTLIQSIYEDGFVNYNDGWFIVEVDYFYMYVDVTGYALREMEIEDYEMDSDIEE